MDIAKYITTAVGLYLVRDKRKGLIMYALMTFGFVSVIAIVGGVYFWLQDRKKAHKKA